LRRKDAAKDASGARGESLACWEGSSVGSVHRRGARDDGCVGGGSSSGLIGAGSDFWRARVDGGDGSGVKGLSGVDGGGDDGDGGHGADGGREGDGLGGESVWAAGDFGGAAVDCGYSCGVES